MKDKKSYDEYMRLMKVFEIRKIYDILDSKRVRGL